MLGCAPITTNALISYISYRIPLSCKHAQPLLSSLVMFTISCCRNYNRAADPPCLTFADGASVTHAHAPNMPSHLPLYIRRHADNPQQVCTNVCPATCWACYVHDIAGFSYLAPCPLLVIKLQRTPASTVAHRSVVTLRPLKAAT